MNYSDLISQHSAYSTRYSTYVINRILNNLDKSDRRITRDIARNLEGMTQRDINEYLQKKYTTRRLIKLRENIRALAKSFRSGTMQGLAENGPDLADYEVEYGYSLAALSKPDVIKPKLSKHQVYAAAMSRPLLGRFVRDSVAGLETTYYQQLDSEIRLGYQEGLGSSSIMRRIRGSAPEKYRDGVLYRRNGSIDRVIRTSLNHISNQARQSSMLEMGVEKVQWLSTLDGRTSDTCALRDRLIYGIKSGPRPPAHPNCRSQVVPYFGETTSGRRPSIADKRKLGDIPEKERKKKVKQVNSSTNYSQWFKNQDAAFQKEWLGPTKYKLYKQGNYPLSRFVDERQKPYTIRQLRELDKQTFKNLNL